MVAMAGTMLFLLLKSKILKVLIQNCIMKANEKKVIFVVEMNSFRSTLSPNCRNDGFPDVLHISRLYNGYALLRRRVEIRQFLRKSQDLSRYGRRERNTNEELSAS